MVSRKAHEVDSWLKAPDSAIAMVLLYGPDRGLVGERAQHFANSTGLPLDDVFAVSRMTAGDLEDDPGRLIDDARTVPMFGGKRLIWVRDVVGQGPLVNALGELLENPPEDAIVLIEAGDLKKTAKLRTMFEKSKRAVALPCFSDDARAIDRLIDDELAAAGISINLDARQALKRLLGGDRMASRGEIRKLVLYTHGRNNIGLADVANAVGDASALSQDDIVDAVISGDPAAMDEAFTRMMRSGAPPFLSAAAAMRQFHVLQSLRDMVENGGKTPAAAVTATRPPVFFTRRNIVEKAVSAVDGDFVVRALERLQQTILRSRQHPELAVPLVRQALLALTLEISAVMRRRVANR